MTMRKPKRVFWLGMHKVLKPTELKRLRGLGVEVFNPAYISPIYDQSADLTVDLDQPTTLPKHVFRKLMAHNFFYTEVPDSIAEILNEYFDCAIITISADWLKSFVSAFRGQIIYRVYGQHFSLSQKMIDIGLWTPLVEREAFSIVPFARESIQNEHQWFVDMCTHVAPYQIPDDVFEHSGRWARTEHRREIATSIPNIQNPYFEAAYQSFQHNYKQKLFKIYGPQRATPNDSRIVGRLERQEFLSCLAESSAFFYDYKDDVCYLPPIEMMEIGGPVVYARGSLLDRFFGGRGPGSAEDPVEAAKKLKWLLNGDKAFADEIISAQEPVRQRYDRAIVGPIFDTVFSELLSQEDRPPAVARQETLIVGPIGKAPSRKVVIPLHVDGLFGHERGRAYAFEGIPRVVDIVVDTLVSFSDVDVIVSCTALSAPIVYDFFREHIQKGRVSLYVIPRAPDVSEEQADLNRLQFIEDINKRDDVAVLLVPHYYLFPEALLSKHPLALYLPDYFPHLMPELVFDMTPEKDAENKRVGVAIAEAARAILTNSNFTKRYLPDAGFVEPDAKKVVVAPLPFLGTKRAGQLDGDEARMIEERVGARQFLFYPTANRPNKQIDFLLRLFTALRATRPGLALVLTCSLGTYAPAAEAARRYGVENEIIFLPRASEGVLKWLYEHAAALCLTSTLEGNFPPQVLEALNYSTPIVATRLPTITEILGERADQLLLCRPRNLDDFIAGVNEALEQPDQVKARQEAILREMQRWNSPDKFFAHLQTALLDHDRISEQA
jgi:glycosyltransferase involved in cell wall biosynthesis